MGRVEDVDSVFELEMSSKNNHEIGVNEDIRSRAEDNTV